MQEGCHGAGMSQAGMWCRYESWFSRPTVKGEDKDQFLYTAQDSHACSAEKAECGRFLMSLLLRNPTVPLEVVPCANWPSAMLNSFLLCKGRGTGSLFPGHFFCNLWFTAQIRIFRQALNSVPAPRQKMGLRIVSLTSRHYGKLQVCQRSVANKAHCFVKTWRTQGVLCRWKPWLSSPQNTHLFALTDIRGLP